MDKQEKIVCAAIEFTTEDLFISTQQDKYVLCGVKYEEIKDFNNSVICREVLHAQSGFVTNKNRFVDPVEAQQIAIACGQYRDPHARIKSLEESIEIGWDSVKYAKTGVMITSLKKRISEDQAKLDELKAGYLGNSLREEDLHYV